MVGLFVAIFLGPILVVVSMIVDLTVCFNVFLRSSGEFEHKYQNTGERLNAQQMRVVTGTLLDIFGRYDAQFRGYKMTLIELMIMHLKIF